MSSSETDALPFGDYHGGTLWGTMHSARVPIIEKDLIREHKRQVIEECRGGRKITAWTLIFLQSLLSVGSLLGPFDYLSRTLGQTEKMDRMIGVLYIPCIVAMAGAAFFLGNLAHWLLGVFLFLLPFLCIGGISVFSARINGTRYERMTGLWVTKPIEIDDIPARLQDRAERCESMDGVRFEVDRFETDPFYYAVRGWWLFRERVCFGAEDTGVPGFDET